MQERVPILTRKSGIDHRLCGVDMTNWWEQRAVWLQRNKSSTLVDELHDGSRKTPESLQQFACGHVYIYIKKKIQLRSASLELLLKFDWNDFFTVNVSRAPNSAWISRTLVVLKSNSNRDHYEEKIPQEITATLRLTCKQQLQTSSQQQSCGGVESVVSWLLKSVISLIILQFTRRIHE